MRAFRFAALLLVAACFSPSSATAGAFEGSVWVEKNAQCGPIRYNNYNPENACCCYEPWSGYIVRDGYFGRVLDCYQICWLWRQYP
jgi:hypothetical protein